MAQVHYQNVLRVSVGFAVQSGRDPREETRGFEPPYGTYDDCAWSASVISE